MLGLFGQRRRTDGVALGGPRLVADRYELLERIGSGGTAEVWLAWDRRLDAPCAIKELRGLWADHEPLRARFAREALLLRQLAHPHVVTVYDLLREGAQARIVMEWASRGSLADWVRRDGPLAPRVAVELVQGVLAALELAHQHGVIHRDVKPGNVLLDRRGVARLADFGVASLADDAGGARHPGTDAYMAPEQRAGGRIDGRADVYAAAATLYHLLTGLSPAGLHEAHEGSPRWAGLPAPLRGPIFLATRPSPLDRPQSAAALRRALEAAQGSLAPIAALTLPPERPLPPRAARSPRVAPTPARSALAAAGRTLAVGLGLSLGVVLGPTRPEPTPVQVAATSASVAPTSVASTALVPVSVVPAPIVALAPPAIEPPARTTLRRPRAAASAPESAPSEPPPADGGAPEIAITITASAPALVALADGHELRTDPLGRAASLRVAPGLLRLRLSTDARGARDAVVVVPDGVRSGAIHCAVRAEPLVCVFRPGEGPAP